MSERRKTLSSVLLVQPAHRISWAACGRNIAPCRAAHEEYDLSQGSRRFDCSALCCARFLT